MEALKITVNGLLNSFRIGEFHTYQKTLPFPPKTTVLGMIGASLGIPPEEANELIPDIRIGILINDRKNQGQANDLWRYLKFKAGNDKPINDILIRELLYKISYTIYISSIKDNLLVKIKDALVNPKWALSLGREDELIFLSELIFPIKLEKVPSGDTIKLKNVVVNFSLREHSKPSEQALNNFLQGNIKNISLPKSFKLPISFSYSEKGRSPDKYQTFSVIEDFEIELDTRKIEREFYSDGTNTFQFF